MEQRRAFGWGEVAAIWVAFRYRGDGGEWGLFRGWFVFPGGGVLSLVSWTPSGVQEEGERKFII